MQPQAITIPNIQCMKKYSGKNLLSIVKQDRNLWSEQSFPKMKGLLKVFRCFNGILICGEHIRFHVIFSSNYQFLIDSCFFFGEIIYIFIERTCYKEFSEFLKYELLYASSEIGYEFMMNKNAYIWFKWNKA